MVSTCCHLPFGLCWCQERYQVVTESLEILIKYLQLFFFGPPGSVRGSDYFLHPGAAQRAATVLGVDHDTLCQDIFSPPRGGTVRSNPFTTSFSSTSSPNQSDTTSITSSLFLTNVGSNRSTYLDSFVMGLYEQAFNALVMLINRSLQPQLGAKARSTIHVLDTPGFQHRELAGAKNGASFDDLCMNYVQERLQMLFHDVSFTSEQDRYLQEEINWMFSEVAASPLAIIDTIDRHVPQVSSISLDFPFMIRFQTLKLNQST